MPISPRRAKLHSHQPSHSISPHSFSGCASCGTACRCPSLSSNRCAGSPATDFSDSLLMIYLDTSAAVPLFVTEHSSDLIDHWFSACDESVVSSDWIITEFASALSIKVRAGSLSAKDANAAWRGFEAFCQSGLRLAPVSRQTFAQAAKMVRAPAHGLRSSDALHLAAALEIGADTIATLDTSMSRNATRLRLKTVAFS